jgi:hypothetical protein
MGFLCPYHSFLDIGACVKQSLTNPGNEGGIAMRNILKKVICIPVMMALLTVVGCSQPAPIPQPRQIQPAQPVVEYSLAVAVKGQGTTNPSTGTYTYYKDQSATITAAPIVGWQFDRWSGDTSGTVPTTTIGMDRNKSVIANFVKQPTSFGPSSFNIGKGSGDWTIPSINIGDRIEFNFTVAGADVRYSAKDPNGNTILTGNSGNKCSSGSGSFIASTDGDYKLYFTSTGILTPSVLTVYYTIYFAPPK